MALVSGRRAWGFLDTHAQDDPTAEQIAEVTLQASHRLKLFGIESKVALLSHSNFGRSSQQWAYRDGCFPLAAESHASQLQSCLVDSPPLQ